MTTKVVISCPDNSHWHVKVTVRDKLYDPKSQKYVPGQYTRAQTHILKQGEKVETYLTDSRSLEVEEIVPEAPEAVADKDATKPAPEGF